MRAIAILLLCATGLLVACDESQRSRARRDRAAALRSAAEMRGQENPR
jgi:hypothetical protein